MHMLRGLTQQLTSAIMQICIYIMIRTCKHGFYIIIQYGCICTQCSFLLKHQMTGIKHLIVLYMHQCIASQTGTAWLCCPATRSKHCCCVTFSIVQYNFHYCCPQAAASLHVSGLIPGGSTARVHVLHGICTHMNIESKIDLCRSAFLSL